jgi:D-alanyl-D-alanine carboxypeptidase
MKRTHAKIAVLGLALSFLAGGGSSATASRSAAPPETVHLREALAALVAAGVPGALVVVRDGDRTVRLAAGYGDLARRTPMRATDRFRIGSETKTFVATVVLQLVGERRLSLADTVERWLPGLVPGGQKITVRQLLNHTSGLFDYAEDKVFERQLDNPVKVWAPRRLVAIATAHAPLFPPGARWSYSNTGYILLGLIVEQATGSSLGSQLRKRIFAPLRLRATSFDTKPQIAGRHAHGYTRFRKPRLTDVSVISPSLLWAAGAIVSTADDLVRFHRALFRGRLLRPGLLAAMETTVRVTPEQRYGLGVFRTRWPCGVFWGHGGEIFGYETFADSRSDGKRDLVVAINADGSVRGVRAERALGRLTAIAHCGWPLPRRRGRQTPPRACCTPSRTGRRP